MISLLISTLLHGFSHNSWAEETLAKMTLKEKVGRLFIVPACPLRGEDHWNDLHHLICHHHIGGIILKQGNAESQVALINELGSPILYYVSRIMP